MDLPFYRLSAVLREDVSEICKVRYGAYRLQSSRVGGHVRSNTDIIFGFIYNIFASDESTKDTRDTTRIKGFNKLSSGTSGS